MWLNRVFMCFVVDNDVTSACAAPGHWVHGVMSRPVGIGGQYLLEEQNRFSRSKNFKLCIPIALVFCSVRVFARRIWISAHSVLIRNIPSSLLWRCWLGDVDILPKYVCNPASLRRFNSGISIEGPGLTWSNSKKDGHKQKWKPKLSLVLSGKYCKNSSISRVASSNALLLFCALTIPEIARSNPSLAQAST